MTVDKKHSPRCFIDIEIDGENAGRIIMELFTDVCPITCENFRALCTGEKGIGKTTDKPLHYKGAPFHRVVKNFVIQGGDFVAGNGTGGESIYGGQFKDENFDIPHDKPFLLSMSNRGKDSNGSQFFITTQAAPHLNGKHTVFGQVIHGQEVVTKIENIKTDQSCRPTKDVKISNCGELVLKIHQKERKRRVSTESSDSESEEERLKRKRKHKHSKKHKKEKKETRESNPSRKEEDSGCMVDPEEIPTIPTNNFLMRRTSPLGDRNRRPPPRESYSYGRPVVSRSGRKIKGRGFMRYRTPSRSTSRSGSETPPHWKQAQSRLRNIKDVVLPKKPLVPPEESESQPEDMEDARGNVLHSRLGMVSRATEDQKQKDARLIMRENRRNREWSSEESPPRNAPRGTGGSPLRSTVVVTSNFQKEPDRFRRTDWRSGNRRGRSPERRPFDRFNDNDSNRNRRQVAADSHKKTERPQRSEKDIVKSFRALADDLTRYRKDVESDESTDREKDRGDKSKDRVDKDCEIKAKESRLEKPSKPQSKRLKLLQDELFRYHKNYQSSSESSEEDETENVKKDSEKVGANPSKEDTSKALKSVESELSKYRKDKSDNSSDGSNNEKITSQRKKVSNVLPHISEENTITSNGNDEENTENITMPNRITGFGIDHSKVKIPGICDSNEASMDTESQPQSVTDMEFQPASRQGAEGHKMPVQLIESNEVNTDKVLPAVKEKRRWDMQETETKKKAQESIQIVFHTATLTMPEVIPLPEETRSVKTEAMDVSEPQGMLSVARATKSKTPPMDYGRSKSPNEKVPSSPPMKSSKHISKEQDASANPNQKHSSIASRTTAKDLRSPSHSPKTASSSKHIPRSPSNSPPTRRKSSSSPEPRTKKLRSKSPVSRRTRASKSPASRSKSPISRRARQSKSPRRARPSVSRSRSRDRIRRRRSRSPLNVRSRRSISRERGSRFRRYGNRSPDRRGGFRYGKSPSFRGRLGGRARRTRSRSPIKRRRARRSSSSSGSSSSRSSSSRSDRRKKVAKGKRRSSSSSSSSRSKKSDSDSASP